MIKIVEDDSERAKCQECGSRGVLFEIVAGDEIDGTRCSGGFWCFSCLRVLRDEILDFFHWRA